MADFKSIAVACLEKGFSVIPLEPAGKAPVAGLGVLSRTRDPLQVEKWAELYPTANVGICADAETVILESDNITELDTLLKNARGHSMAEVLTLCSCGSSEDRPHFFFKATPAAKNLGCLKLPGVFEARFSNQYVVGPGSVHPDGSRYRWLNDRPMVEVPDWLASGLLYLANNQSFARHNPAVATDLDGNVTEGGRHYALVREAGRMWDGKISEEELYAKLSHFNVTRCIPPREEAHVKQCVRDIMRRDPFDPGPKVVINGKPVEEKSDSFAFPKVPGHTRDYVLRPLHSLFDGWFPRGRVSIVGGSSGVGKTTFVVDLLHRQCKRKAVLGHEGTASKFLVLFADRTHLSNKETLERMGFEDSDEIPIAYMPVTWDEAAVNQIRGKVEGYIEAYGYPPGAVFVEGADALVSDANKAQVVAPFMAGIQKIAEWYHIAVILSCGAPKQKPKDQYAQTRDRVFGSQMWPRMAEDIVVISHDSESDNRHLVIEHRNARREKFTLKFEGGLLVHTPDLVTPEGVEETKKAVTDSQAEMIEVLEKLPPGTRISPNDFSWLDANTVYKYFKVLARPESRRVGKDSSGKWVVTKSKENKCQLQSN